MPYGNKARCVRAYEFGCLPPTEGEQKAIEVMRGRVQFWNQLVELDKRYSDQKEELIKPHIDVPDDEEHRDEYKKQRKAAFKLENVKVALKKLDKAEYEESKKLYQDSGLYWGNYLDVHNSWQIARKKPGELRFHSSRDGGKVHVQWPKGMKVADAFDHISNVLRLGPVPPEAYTIPQRSVRRKLQCSTVSIRIESTEDRNPVWLTLPCVLHRPLPENGLIRSADVICRRVGTHWRWKLVIIVETEPDNAAPDTDNKSGAIAIDIGWRKRPDGLRVCYWSDTFGRQGELLLSNYFLTGMGRVDSIKSKRDLDFNQARSDLAEWKMSNTNTLPEWFKERTQNLSQWRSAARLASLVIFWRQNRFDGDNDIYQAMEAWRKEDKHHYEYEANLRDRLIRRRREQYRIFASQVAHKYKTVIIEDFDLRNVTVGNKQGGAADDVPDMVNRQRQLSAVSILRLALLNACKREGVAVLEVESKYTTSKCHLCGQIVDTDKPEKLVYICTNCNASYDQDYNACKNLLRAYADR